MTTIYIKNRLPSPKTLAKTPFEIMYKSKPSGKSMRVFGFRAYVPTRKRSDSSGIQRLMRDCSRTPTNVKGVMTFRHRGRPSGDRSLEMSRPMSRLLDSRHHFRAKPLKTLRWTSTHSLSTTSLVKRTSKWLAKSEKIDRDTKKRPIKDHVPSVVELDLKRQAHQMKNVA